MWLSTRCNTTGLTRLINLKNMHNIDLKGVNIKYTNQNLNPICYVYSSKKEAQYDFNKIIKGLRNGTPFIDLNEVNECNKNQKDLE
jgi:hypothetical protein